MHPNLPCRQAGPLDCEQPPAPHDMTVRASQSAKQRHHRFGLAQRQLGFKDEASVPTSCRCLEALVLPIGHLEEQQQPIGEHHERMFS
jgi:hypothetical protein